MSAKSRLVGKKVRRDTSLTPKRAEREKQIKWAAKAARRKNRRTD